MLRAAAGVGLRAAVQCGAAAAGAPACWEAPGSNIRAPHGQRRKTRYRHERRGSDRGSYSQREAGIRRGDGIESRHKSWELKKRRRDRNGPGPNGRSDTAGSTAAQSPTSPASHSADKIPKVSKQFRKSFENVKGKGSTTGKPIRRSAVDAAEVSCPDKIPKGPKDSKESLKEKSTRQYPSPDAAEPTAAQPSAPSPDRAANASKDMEESRTERPAPKRAPPEQPTHPSSPEAVGRGAAEVSRPDKIPKVQKNGKESLKEKSTCQHPPPDAAEPTAAQPSAPSPDRAANASKDMEGSRAERPAPKRAPPEQPTHPSSPEAVGRGAAHPSASSSASEKAPKVSKQARQPPADRPAPKRSPSENPVHKRSLWDAMEPAATVLQVCKDSLTGKRDWRIWREKKKMKKEREREEREREGSREDKEEQSPTAGRNHTYQPKGRKENDKQGVQQRLTVQDAHDEKLAKERQGDRKQLQQLQQLLQAPTGAGAARWFRKGPPVRWADVAGNGDGKAQLQEFASIMQDPTPHQKMGGRIPAGAILHGAPGTGKTLLARALAHEAGITFLSATGSDFIEVYGGSGAKSVRHLFDTARRASPCVLFIDEIDSVASKRSGGTSYNTNELHLSIAQEHDSTLNQLLAEIDGIRGKLSRSGIILIAATNRLEVIDPALLRAGRFDRKILVSCPTDEDRQSIFRLYAAKLTLASDIDLACVTDTIVQRTADCSGAVLEQICNEAALCAVRDGAGGVAAEHFARGADAVLLCGSGLPAAAPAAGAREVLAYHEAGRVVVSMEHPGVPATTRATILGRRYPKDPLPQVGEILRSTEYEGRICVLLAGRACEQIFYDDRTTAAHADLKAARELATAYFTTFGMADDAPHCCLQPTSHLLDPQIDQLLKKLFKETADLLFKYEARVSRMAELLLVHETLDTEQIESTRQIDKERIKDLLQSLDKGSGK